MRKTIIIAVAVAAIVVGCAGEQRISYKPARGVKSIYVVKKGDTLTRIAARFGVDVQSLKRANDLTLDLITRGQRLVIPPAGSNSTGKKFAARKKSASYKKRVAKKKKKKVHYSKKAPNINLNLRWPLENGKVTSRFGIRKSGKHDGLDISGAKGTKIYSAAKGKVVFSGKGPTGYGLLVVVKHTDTVYTVYAHNSKNLAKKGKYVKRGEVLALVGRTGRATDNHLHFEVRVNRIAYDPLEYLPKRPL